MTGKVYFTNGCIEYMHDHNFTPEFKTGSFYFTTVSGRYAYEHANIPVTDSLGAVLTYIPTNKFYIYVQPRPYSYGEWLVTQSIDHVEFGTEVLPDGRF